MFFSGSSLAVQSTGRLARCSIDSAVWPHIGTIRLSFAKP